MLRTEQLRERARLLKSCVGPGEIYEQARTGRVVPGVTVSILREGDEYELAVIRSPNMLDAVDLGMVAEAFGVAEGSEPTTRQKNGYLVTTWRWREALPVATGTLPLQAA